MSKKPFTTRIDEEILALAQRLADAERRSVTSLLEVAVLEYAARRGESALLPGAIASRNDTPANPGTMTPPADKPVGAAEPSTAKRRK